MLDILKYINYTHCRTYVLDPCARSGMNMSNLHSKGPASAFDPSGKGRAVILVGGALGVRTHPMFTPLAALLAPHFTMFTYDFNYDRRSRGDSGDAAPAENVVRYFKQRR